MWIEAIRIKHKECQFEWLLRWIWNLRQTHSYPVCVAALYLVGGARATHRCDILTAGGGGNWKRLRRVPWPHGDHRQAQRHQQRGAGTALPLTNTFTIVSETEVSWEFFGFNVILTLRVFIIVIIHLFIFNKSCEMRRTGWKALVVLFLYSEHPIMLGCLGWSWKWLNALLLCSGTVMIREKWSIRSISTFLSGMQDI